MGNKYLDLKEKQSKEFNEFPIGAAFSEEQFNNMMKKFGLEPEETNQILSIGAGCYIKKSDEKAFDEMITKHMQERENAIKADTTGEGYIKDMFSYELANHEYGHTYDLTDTLDALDLTMDEIENNAALKNGLKLALKSYNSELNESLNIDTGIEDDELDDILYEIGKYVEVREHVNKDIIESNIGLIAESVAESQIAEIVDVSIPATLYNSTLEDLEKEYKEMIENNIDYIVKKYNETVDRFNNVFENKSINKLNKHYSKNLSESKIKPKYSEIVEFNGKQFRYDYIDNIVEYVYFDDETNQYEVLSAVGLSNDRWRNKAAREEYLNEWCYDLDEEMNWLTASISDEFDVKELNESEKAAEAYKVDRYRKLDYGTLKNDVTTGTFTDGKSFTYVDSEIYIYPDTKAYDLLVAIDSYKATDEEYDNFDNAADYYDDYIEMLDYGKNYESILSQIGIEFNTEIDESVTIKDNQDNLIESEAEEYKARKIKELENDAIYNFEKAYKDWGTEYVNKQEFLDEFIDEVFYSYDSELIELEWLHFLANIPSLKKYYEKYKDLDMFSDIENENDKLNILNSVVNWYKSVIQKHLSTNESFEAVSDEVRQDSREKGLVEDTSVLTESEDSSYSIMVQVTEKVEEQLEDRTEISYEELEEMIIDILDDMNITRNLIVDDVVSSVVEDLELEGILLLEESVLIESEDYGLAVFCKDGADNTIKSVQRFSIRDLGKEKATNEANELANKLKSEGRDDVSINEYGHKKFIPKELNDYKRNYTNKFNKPVRSIKWVRQSGNTDTVKINGKEYRFNIETKQLEESALNNDEEFYQFIKDHLEDGAIDDPKYYRNLSDAEKDDLIKNTYMKDKDMIAAWKEVNGSALNEARSHKEQNEKVAPRNKLDTKGLKPNDILPKSLRVAKKDDMYSDVYNTTDVEPYSSGSLSKELGAYKKAKSFSDYYKANGNDHLSKEFDKKAQNIISDKRAKRKYKDIDKDSIRADLKQDKRLKPINNLLTNVSQAIEEFEGNESFYDGGWTMFFNRGVQRDNGDIEWEIENYNDASEHNAYELCHYLKNLFPEFKFTVRDDVVYMAISNELLSNMNESVSKKELNNAKISLEKMLGTIDPNPNGKEYELQTKAVDTIETIEDIEKSNGSNLTESVLKETEITPEEFIKQCEESGQFNDDQMFHIKEGFEYGLNMEQVLTYAKPEFDLFQMIQIRTGFIMGLTKEQISVYAKPEFKYGQMDEIRGGFGNGLSMEQILVYAKPEFDVWQMFQIRKGFKSGLTMEQVLTYAKPEIYWEQMEKIRKKLENKNRKEKKEEAYINHNLRDEFYDEIDSIYKKVRDLVIDKLGDTFQVTYKELEDLVSESLDTLEITYDIYVDDVVDYIVEDLEDYDIELVDEDTVKEKPIEKLSNKELLEKYRDKIEKLNSELTAIDNIVSVEYELSNYTKGKLTPVVKVKVDLKKYADNNDYGKYGSEISRLDKELVKVLNSNGLLTSNSQSFFNSQEDEYKFYTTGTKW